MSALAPAHNPATHSYLQSQYLPHAGYLWALAPASLGLEHPSQGGHWPPLVATQTSLCDPEGQELTLQLLSAPPRICHSPGPQVSIV